MFGQKLGHQVKYKEILVYTIGYICDPILIKLGQNVCFDNIQAKFENLSCLVKKTKSPGQILGNSCLHSSGHICDPILMKHGQNVCLENI